MKKSMFSKLIALVLTLVVLLSSCAVTPPPVICDEHFDATEDGVCDICGEDIGDPAPDVKPDPDPDPTPDPKPDDSYVEPENVESPALTYTPLTSIPEYKAGTEYSNIGDGKTPSFTANQLTRKAYEYYSELDDLGRTGLCVAVIGKEIMPTEERGSDSAVTPSGWYQWTYDIISGGYLWHRSHLIAWSLTGESGNPKNLMTGTKFFNTECMTAFEAIVRDYINDTGNHVIYRVVPYYVGDELVARGVHMEAYSIEDNGYGVSFNVFVHNVQEGIEIDYSNGHSKLAGADNPLLNDKPGDYTYVLNISSKKIHLESCRYANSMNESNRVVCSDKTILELFEEGYTHCNTCHPEKRD